MSSLLPIHITEPLVVIHGHGRGKAIGFPTANCPLPEKLKYARQGVYGGHATLFGVKYRMVCSLGTNDTYGADAPTFEIHLLSSTPLNDFYGECLTSVTLDVYVRTMRKFESEKELIDAIANDISSVNQ